MGQFLPSPEQLPKVELDVFGISPSIYNFRAQLISEAIIEMDCNTEA